MKKKIIDGSGKVLFEPADYNVLRITDDELQKTYLEVGISGTDVDVARQILGGDWRIPTSAEMQELETNCTWTFDSTRGGYVVSGNGNSIFLKSTIGSSYGNYMTANSEPSNRKTYYSLYFHSAGKSNLFKTRFQETAVRPVSATQGVDLGLSVKWASANIGANGFVSETEIGMMVAFGELTSKTTYTWDNYMCKEIECGTSADPLMGYYEELEETDHYLNTRGLNIVRKQINDKIDEVEKGMPQPTPIADADETVQHVLGQEVQDNQVVVQPRSINELSDGSRVADLEEWQRSLGIFSIQRGTEEGSWIINVLDAE